MAAMGNPQVKVELASMPKAPMDRQNAAAASRKRKGMRAVNPDQAKPPSTWQKANTPADKAAAVPSSPLSVKWET